jgi:hypothetical protein
VAEQYGVLFVSEVVRGDDVDNTFENGRVEQDGSNHAAFRFVVRWGDAVQDF